MIKKMVLLVLAAVLSGWPAGLAQPAVGPVTAQSAIVMVAATGEVLWEKDADTRRPPASTTKIVTLLLALENGNLDDVVTASQTASQTDGSSIWLEPGERLTLRQLLYGLMLLSGNDAAVAISEHISGSSAAFARLMTDRAHSLGAVSSNFTNPNGLPDDNHYTTARDLAVLTAYGLNHHPEFRQIMGTRETTIPWHGKTFQRELYNENKLLWRYDGANGGKTGYTDAAGPCLVATAERNGVQLVAVVLNCEDMWQDAVNLLDYGFDRTSAKKFFDAGGWRQAVTVTNGYRPTVSLRAADDIVVPAQKDGSDAGDFRLEFVVPRSLRAPLTAGQHVGQVVLRYRGEVVATSDIVTVDGVERRSVFRWLADLVRWWWSMV
ncbi:MAG: D-alanyl-D-alanine carboxypeptidase [Negativicutes bacterium]|nr:D-alanyl-D-alanine carboxypeptidase [Negativicutes bacterium]